MDETTVNFSNPKEPKERIDSHGFLTTEIRPVTLKHKCTSRKRRGPVRRVRQLRTTCVIRIKVTSYLLTPSISS